MWGDWRRRKIRRHCSKPSSSCSAGGRKISICSSSATVRNANSCANCRSSVGARRDWRKSCMAGRGCSSNCFVFTARFVHTRRERRRMSSEKAFTIRSYRSSDRAAVRERCCQTGFLGVPIDPVYEDRQLFADFLTTYYTDHEPESSFVLEVDGEIRGYLLGSRRPLQNQLYA